jgi:O-antigen ligase
MAAITVIGRIGWLWQACLIASYAVSVVRASPALGSDSLAVQATQFVPLLLGAAICIVQGSRHGAHRFRGLAGFSALFALCVFALLSAVWSAEARETVIRAGAMVVVVVFLFAACKYRWINRDALTSDVRLVFILLTATTLAGIVLWLLGNPLAIGNFGRFQGVLPNPNYVAIQTSLAICMAPWLIARHRSSRWLVVSAVGVSAVALLWSGSRGALVATAVALVCAVLVSSWRRRAVRWGVPVALALALLVAAAYWLSPGFAGLVNRSAQSSDFFSGRVEIWVASLELWMTSPVIGIGFGGAQLADAMAGFASHNLFLTSLVELGVIGFVLLAVVFVKLLAVAGRRVGADRIYLAVPAGILVSQLFESSAFGIGGPVALLTWTGLAACLALVNGADRGWNVYPPEPVDSRRLSTVSVCMASYNGAPYIAEQVQSILDQIGEDDELVIVDDASTDETVAIIRSMEDRRIRLIENRMNLGHVATFERSLDAAVGDMILLSDQDDVWVPGRVELLRTSLSEHVAAASNFGTLGDRTSITQGRLRASDSDKRTANFVGLLAGRRSYFGCAMAFRAEFVARAIPFPRSVEAHDHWLAIVGALSGSMAHVEGITVMRRIHEGNLTPRVRRGLGRVIATRIHQIRLGAIAFRRLRKPRPLTVETAPQPRVQ